MKFLLVIGVTAVALSLTTGYAFAGRVLKPGATKPSVTQPSTTKPATSGTRAAGPTDKEIAIDLIRESVGTRTLCACRDAGREELVGIVTVHGNGTVNFGATARCRLPRYTDEGANNTSTSSFCYDYEVIGNLKRGTSLFGD